MRKNTFLAFFLCGVIGAAAFAQDERDYQVKLTNPAGASGLTFEDEFMKISFSPRVNLDFTLINKTDKAVEIDWQKASFVDVTGQTQKVIHEDIRYVAKIDTLPPTLVLPAGRFSDTIVPAGFISHGSEDSERWILRSLYHGGMASYVDKPFSLHLPVTIGTLAKEYVFTFVVEKRAAK